MRRAGDLTHALPPPAGPRRSDWMTLRRLAPYLWEYRWRVLAALAFMIGAKLANVSVPLVLKDLVDAMAPRAGTAAFILAVPAGLLIAIFLNQTVTGIRLYKSLFFFPFVISQVVVGLMFAWFYAPNFGLFYLLTEWITGQGTAILADPDLVTYGIIAAGLWPQIAYVMILYLTGLNNVAPDQIEAARLDGAKGWRMLWYVVLPQLRPATFIAVIVTVIGALRSFDLVSIMTAGGPFGESRVLSYYMFEMALGEFGFRMGYGAAIAVVLFAIMMVFISGFIWKMWRDETER